MGGLGIDEEDRHRAEFAWLLRDSTTVDRIRLTAQLLARERQQRIRMTQREISKDGVDAD